jgi:putative component of toxin-antitoxin plasmid stabilization module
LDAVFVMEPKLKGSAEDALAQFDGKGYRIHFQARGKILAKVGEEFDKTTRNLGRPLTG